MHNFSVPSQTVSEALYTLQQSLHQRMQRTSTFDLSDTNNPSIMRPQTRLPIYPTLDAHVTTHNWGTTSTYLIVSFPNDTSPTFLADQLFITILSSIQHHCQSQRLQPHQQNQVQDVCNYVHIKRRKLH